MQGASLAFSCCTYRQAERGLDCYNIFLVQTSGSPYGSFDNLTCMESSMSAVFSAALTQRRVDGGRDANQLVCGGLPRVKHRE